MFLLFPAMLFYCFHRLLHQDKCSLGQTKARVSLFFTSTTKQLLTLVLGLRVRTGFIQRFTTAWLSSWELELYSFIPKHHVIIIQRFRIRHLSFTILMFKVAGKRFLCLININEGKHFNSSVVWFDFTRLGRQSLFWCCPHWTWSSVLLKSPESCRPRGTLCSLVA